MGSMYPPGSPAAGGLFGALRSWFRDRAGLGGPPSGDLEAEAAWRSAIPSGSVRLLVVDDSSLNLLAISGRLAAKGLVPVMATDGSEAVALACETQFDLILMDIQMPVLNGFDATAAIRHVESTSGLPAVPIVAYSGMDLSARVLAAHGLNGSLAKPCDDDALEECLVRWCPGYRPQPTARDHPVGNDRRQASQANPGQRGPAASPD